MAKIVHLIHGLSTGGAETLVKNYLLNIDKSRFDVVLICLYHEMDSPYEEAVKKSGVRIIFIEDLLIVKRRKNIASRIAHKLNRYIVVKRILKKEAPDVLHTHLMINSMVKFARPKKGTIIFYTIHSDPNHLWFCGDKKRTHDYNAIRWLIKHYDMNFIVLHNRMKTEVKKMFGVSDVTVLNNGVDIEKIKNAANGKETRDKLGIPSDAFLIEHIGRFSNVKNHVFLVDVFKEIAKKNNKAFLLMIGNGSEKRRIIEKLDNSNLKGKYLVLNNRDDIPNLLNAMDVFVFPSLYEGLPLSLIEAQIARKPCFVSNRIDRHAFISNLVTGLSIDDDAIKWANTILSYKKPKEIIINDDGWDIKMVTKKLEQIYLNALVRREDGKK